MNNLKLKDLIEGEIYYHKCDGYNYKYIFLYDGKDQYYKTSGPYYISFQDNSPFLGKNYKNPYKNEDILRLATFEEKELIIKMIKFEDPKFEYKLGEISNYEIY